MKTIKITFSDGDNETTKAIRLPESYDEVVIRKLFGIMADGIIKEIIK